MAVVVAAVAEVEGPVAGKFAGAGGMLVDEEGTGTAEVVEARDRLQVYRLMGSIRYLAEVAVGSPENGHLWGWRKSWC